MSFVFDKRTYHSQLTLHEVMQRTGEASCVRRWNPTHAYRKLSRVVASISRKPRRLSSLVQEVHEWFDHRVINSIHYRYINPWCATTFANSRQMSLYYNSVPNKCKWICRLNGDTVQLMCQFRPLSIQMCCVRWAYLNDCLTTGTVHHSFKNLESVLTKAYAYIYGFQQKMAWRQSIHNLKTKR